MTFRNFVVYACRSCAIVLLVFGSRQVIADCRSELANDWKLDHKCTTMFDSAGQYVESYCHLDANTRSSGRSHLTCTTGTVPGTCIGSTCDDPPSCTWTGGCLTELDCCGENVCDETTHRCSDPNRPSGWGLFQ